MHAMPLILCTMLSLAGQTPVEEPPPPEAPAAEASEPAEAPPEDAAPAPAPTATDDGSSQGAPPAEPQETVELTAPAADENAKVPRSAETEPSPMPSMLAAAGATLGAFAAIDLVGALVALVPTAFVVVVTAVFLAAYSARIPGRQVNAVGQGIQTALDAMAIWATVFAFVTAALAIVAGLAAVPVAALAGRRVAWFGPWLAGALLPWLGYVAGVLGVALLGVVSAWLGVLSVAVSIAARPPANVTAMLQGGTAVAVGVLGAATIVGAALASQVLAAAAVAWLVRSASRAVAPGEGALHGDLFRLSPAERESVEEEAP